jgi:hypothetical protein
MLLVSPIHHRAIPLQLKSLGGIGSVFVKSRRRQYLGREMGRHDIAAPHNPICQLEIAIHRGHFEAARRRRGRYKLPPGSLAQHCHGSHFEEQLDVDLATLEDCAPQLGKRAAEPRARSSGEIAPLAATSRSAIDVISSLVAILTTRKSGIGPSAEKAQRRSSCIFALE